MVRETRSPLPTNAMGGESLVMVSGTSESGTLSVNNAALLLTPWADALICVVPDSTAVARPFAIYGRDRRVAGRPGERDSIHGEPVLISSKSAELLRAAGVDGNISRYHVDRRHRWRRRRRRRGSDGQ